MRYFKYLFFTLAVAVLTVGCIKENLDDCYNLSLKLSYNGDSAFDDMFSEAIEKVDLYIFDDSGNFEKSISFYKNELGSSHNTPLIKLRPGKFFVVAVANAFDMTDVVISEDGDWSNSYIRHPEFGESGGCVDGHDHNYIGYAEIEMKSHKILEESLMLYSAHIDVSVELTGLKKAGVQGKSVKGDASYRIVFENSNGVTDFRNRVVAGESSLGMCEPVLMYSEEDGMFYTDNLALFRMDEQCGHVMKVISPEGNEVISLDICEYLAAHPEIDITKEEALLPIEVKFSTAGVEIVVPEWYIEDVKPEF